MALGRGVYFIRSSAFLNQICLGFLLADDVYAVVKEQATDRRVGSVFFLPIMYSLTWSANDWEYRILSHSTGHALLTLGYLVQRRTVVVAVPA